RKTESPAGQGFWGCSHYEVLGGRMVHYERRSRLLRLKLKAGSQANADVLFRFEQREQLALVFQVGAGRIAERVARATIFLVEEIADAGSVVNRNAQLFADTFVHQLRQRFGGFHA